MRVRDLMTSKVQTCGPGATAADAARLMWEHDIGAVPIIDTQGRPLGMVTDRDLCMASYTRGQSLRDMTIITAMSKQVFSCRDSDSLGEAERLMQHHQVRRLPVVNEAGKLVGLLSLNDIVIARTGTKAAKFVEQALGDVTATMAAICQHRKVEQVHS